MKLKRHTKTIVQLLFLLLFCTPIIQAQNTVDQIFTKSTTKKISLDEKKLSAKSTRFNQSIDLGEYGVYDLSLEQTYLFSEAYVARRANKNNDADKVPLTFRGTIQGQPNTLVSLTTNKDFLSGFIDTGEEVIFFEPYKNFDSDAQKNELIIYYQKDVIDKGHVCTANHTDEQATQIKPQNPQFKSAAAGCYEVEMVLVADYGMYQKHGASTLSHITSVLNNVKANYDNEFNDPITFIVVDDYIAKTSGQNLWSSTLFAEDLLDEFRDSDFTDVAYDLASLWVTRNIWGEDDDGTRNDNVVGLAKRGGLCGSRYNLIEDFSSSSAELRVTLAHEIGHNFNAEHDAEDSPTIMRPTVNVTNTWSTQSKNQINAFYPNATCLCASGDAADLNFRSCGTSSLSGNTLTISDVEVKNNGTISAGTVKVGWYLSTDSNITTSDYLISTRNTPTLQVGYYTTFNLTANLGSIPPGNYYLGTIIDYENDLVEFSEDNNTGCVSSSADITITATQPDLQISACGISYSSGTTRYFSSIKVKNSGTTSSGAAKLGVYLSSNSTVNTSDYKVGTTNIPALSGGATSSSLTVSFNTATVTGVPAGNYYVGLIADADNNVTESNESNNVSCVSSSASITIPTQTEPDLIISAKSVNSTSVACGSSISASATVKNNGDASTGRSSYMGYYLSSNTTLDANDVYLTNDYVGTLAANATSNESASLNIPAATAAGNYYILFVADYQKVVSESNENNNVAYQAINVTCVAPKPDLIISAKSVNSTSVACGSSISASATVKNNGNASTGRSSYMGYYLSSNTTLDANDVYLTNDYVGTLAANATSNESASLNIPAATAAGNYYILFVADYQKVVSESNENNNVAYQAINVTCVAPKPDLIISAKSVNSTSVACGSSISASATVKNNGNASTGIASYMGYYLSSNTTLDATDIYLMNDYVVTLAANATSNESATLNIPATTTAGNYYILFVADYESAVTESNENNNVAYQAITVTCAAPKPDLIISAKSVNSTSVACGSSISASATVKNNGDASTGRSSYMGYYLSSNTTLDANDVYLTNDYVGTLAANATSNESASLNIPAATVAGNYYILFVADYQKVVSESNENNNVAYQAINVTCVAPKPDLIISAKSVNSTSVACGSSVPASATVKNNGNGSTGRSSYMGYYLSSNTTLDANDVYLTNDYVGTLAANATSNEVATLNIPAATTAGNYYILFAADYQKVITESNENNNVAYQAITVTCVAPKPDLIISAKSVNAASGIACGGTVSVSATVKNNGNASTGGVSYLGYYLSSNTTLDATDTNLGIDYVGTLTANATSNEVASLNIPAATTAGNYYILFVADYQKVVTESNENNNVAYQAITVTCVAPKPDLIISAKSVNAASGIACGGTVSASATVKNNGDASTGRSSYMGYYLSSNTTLDANDVYLTNDYVGTLAANATSNEVATLNIPTATTAGNYYILFAADYQKVITESNENNNVAYQAINVTCGTNCRYTDSLALVDVFNALNGNTWRTGIRWDLTKPMDTWHGITLNQNQCVDKLAIYEEYFGGTLSPSICNLSEITYIDLGENQISGTIPANIGNLSNLTFLSLGVNKLTGGIPASIGNLVNLTNLYLNSNQLTSLPASIRDLSNLESLILSGNELTNVPASIGDLGSLKTLYLHSNLLTNIPSTIGDLSNLTALAINDNQLINVPASIGNLSKLSYLELSGNQLTALPASIGELTELSRFYLSKNQLTYLPTSIGNLSKLRFLYLEDNQLTALPTTMANLSKLYTLYAHRNKIAGAMPEWLADLEDLRTLITYSNQFSGCYSDKLAVLCTRLSSSYSKNTYISNGNNFTIPWEDFCNGTTCTSDLCGDDSNTLLNLPFDYNRNGTKGETPTASQYVSLGGGKHGNGANIIEYSDTPTLKYEAANNINSQQGTVEAWVKPTWNGNDGKGHTILQYGAGGGILILKDGANNLRLIINRFSPSGYPEQGVAYNISNWQANQWRHVAFTWGGGQLRLYIDGSLVAQQAIYSTPLFPISDTEFNIGTDAGWNVWQGTIDHLRISNVVRSQSQILEFRNNCINTKVEEGYTLETHSYPNPFTDHATIMYTLPQESPVTLNVYNSEGKQVASLENNEVKTAGTHTAAFRADALPAGMYYYTIQAGEYFGTQKIVLMK